jgi:aspartate racemase
MKTIGMIGGMSWESSLTYYRMVNQIVKKRLGGFHSAECLMYSVDFHEIEQHQARGEWRAATQSMIDVARKVEKGGADFLIICTNTMHKMADAVQESIQIPLLHIADPTADKVKSLGIKKIALLGTRFTMEQDFYKGKLIDDHGLEVILPTDAEMDVVHNIIYQELCLGEIKTASRTRYLDIIDNLIRNGAEGVILGCTEIGLLVKDGDSQVPFFDTAEIHAEAAVDYALT